MKQPSTDDLLKQYYRREKALVRLQGVGIVLCVLVVMCIFACLAGCQTAQPCVPAPIPTPHPPELINDGTPSSLVANYWAIWGSWLECNGLIAAHNAAIPP